MQAHESYWLSAIIGYLINWWKYQNGYKTQDLTKSRHWPYPASSIASTQGASAKCGSSSLLLSRWIGHVSPAPRGLQNKWWVVSTINTCFASLRPTYEPSAISDFRMAAPVAHPSRFYIFYQCQFLGCAKTNLTLNWLTSGEICFQVKMSMHQAALFQSRVLILKPHGH